MADVGSPSSLEVAAALLDFRDEEAFATASRRLHEALLTAKLLVPITGAHEESDEELDVRLVAAPGPSGAPRLLAFTSELTFGLGGQSPPFAVAPAPDLCGFALRNDVDQLSIDSGGPVSATLERWEVEALARVHRPSGGRRERPPLRMFGISSDLPAALEHVLREVFAPAPVFLLEQPGDGGRHLVLGCVAVPAISPEELRTRLGPHVEHDRVSVLRLSAEQARELELADVPRLRYPT